MIEGKEPDSSEPLAAEAGVKPVSQSLIQSAADELWLVGSKQLDTFAVKKKHSTPKKAEKKHSPADLKRSLWAGAPDRSVETVAGDRQFKNGGKDGEGGAVGKPPASHGNNEVQRSSKAIPLEAVLAAAGELRLSMSGSRYIQETIKEQQDVVPSEAVSLPVDMKNVTGPIELPPRNELSSPSVPETPVPAPQLAAPARLAVEPVIVPGDPVVPGLNVEKSVEILKTQNTLGIVNDSPVRDKWLNLFISAAMLIVLVLFGSVVHGLDAKWYKILLKVLLSVVGVYFAFLNLFDKNVLIRMLSLFLLVLFVVCSR